MKKVIEAVKAARRAFVQRYNEKGQEVPDPRPVEIPLGLRRPKDIHEMIHDALRGERMRLAAEQAGVESWEEANDFEVGEETELVSLYQLTPMQDEVYDYDRSTHQKEKRNVQQRRVEGDRERSGGAGKEREPVGGEGRSAGKRSGRVSEGVSADSKRVAKGGEPGARVRNGEEEAEGSGD